MRVLRLHLHADRKDPLRLRRSRSKGDAVCTNRATIQHEESQPWVLDGLRVGLLHPEPITAFVEEYRRAFNATAADAGAARDKARHDLATVEEKA